MRGKDIRDKLTHKYKRKDRKTHSFTLILFLTHRQTPAVSRRKISTSASAMCAHVCMCVYLLGCNHGDDVNPLLPDHLPEVGTGAGERALGGNVAPLLPSDHHLGKHTHMKNQLVEIIVTAAETRI